MDFYLKIKFTFLLIIYKGFGLTIIDAYSIFYSASVYALSSFVKKFINSFYNNLA